MRRVALKLVLICAVSLALASVASAADDGFTLGSSDLGPVVGVGNTNGAGASFGGRFEHGFKEVANGVVGIGVGIDYYSSDFDTLGVSNSKFSVIPISVTANYHFRLNNGKIDPFVGAGIGYQHASASAGGIGISGSSTGVIGRVGIRYYMKPKTAFFVDAGGGGSAVHAGIMFKFGGE